MCKINMQDRNSIQWRIQNIQRNFSAKGNTVFNSNKGMMLGDVNLLSYKVRRR